MKCKQKFQIKRQQRLRQKDSGTKDDVERDGGMPPKSEARQAQALPSFRCTIVVCIVDLPPPPSPRSACCSDCDYFDDDDDDRFVPCAHCAPADASQRPSSLALPLPLPLILPLVLSLLLCKQMHVLPKKKKEIPGQDRSQKRAKGAAVKPPTRQPTPSTARESERERENHQR